MIICLKDDISQDKIRTLIIDVIAQYSHSLCYSLYCSVVCDILSLTEILKKYSSALNENRVINRECVSTFPIFTILLPSQLRNNVRRV